MLSPRQRKRVVLVVDTVKGRLRQSCGPLAEFTGMAKLQQTDITQPGSSVNLSNHDNTAPNHHRPCFHTPYGQTRPMRERLSQMTMPSPTFMN